MSHAPAYFDELFTGSDDPWKFQTRWYEERKRAVTLAALPARRYAHGYEPGCANGVLSAALAERCDRLLVSDGSSRAVGLARQRLVAQRHVEVRQAWVPAEWPSAQFDLIVVSELGYFLAPADMDTLLDKALGTLAPGGTLVGCHWRHRADDCEWDGNDVHRLMREKLALPVVAQWTDHDFVLEVWCRDTQSVAQREGLA